ncbi:methyl-accepting chemotaxis protein [Pectobacterium atrosepticum]|uniref:methyl-accepting chemotaxis protein n=1 Tax=Pectobacterium atrosepticum TaxID=29471 RepID=UPI0003A2183B|nr:methyl-accepting chemotaxis protein [Pectobacterium atrosepticum]GKV85095.1 methyl-accepting chemotaxis protein [Pectobacterium carotovorum subsp. carotovorum]AIA71379.1 Trg [Pectobacterium atrosepticum]AIK13800.1 putative methyl-accepting chemotaxis citrate transducer [Pectobacterium atrosepticum]ATY90639.1 methyl-accepting chemotaxis protein [Pectobacterium atrosepticum]KFX16139.1 Trg [Pectobacterium atrosepticum]
MFLAKKIRNLKISQKLYLGFGVILLLVIIASLLSAGRFREIRDIYEKTNLIYNINIEVFQAKINRLKYFYSYDEKSRETMAGFVKHASELTTEAKTLSWSPEGLTLINDLSQHLAEFQSAITDMGKATQRVVENREKISAANGQNITTDFYARLRQQPSDSATLYQAEDLATQVSELRQASYELQLRQNADAAKQFDAVFSRFDSSYQGTVAVLTPEQKVAVESLRSYVTGYKKLNNDYFQSINDLKKAEDGVKVGGDKSSASIKAIITIVKEKNDALAYGSATITMIIGFIAVVIGIIISLLITRQITRPVIHNLSLAEKIAAGDLTSTITVDRDDELGQLTAAMGRMNEKLRHMISDVRDSVDSVSTSAAKIAAGNSDLSSRTEQQSAAVVETAASMEELTSTVKNNAENAKQASQISTEASQNAHKGGEVVRNVVDTMSGISDSSRKIADITAVINSIAFQTNILALNAAVEAARAGEQGRGFAVVASEVRTLSQRTSQAAKEIASLISESVARINVGTQLVANAGTAMDQIVSSVSRVNDIMGEIASASDEQSRGIEQISRAISELDTTTQQNAALVMESSISANSLEEQSAILESMVANFRLSENEGRKPKTNISGLPPQQKYLPPAAKQTQDSGWTTF